MTQQNQTPAKPIHPTSIGMRMLQGAGIGLMLISIFLFSAWEPNPDWPKLWMIKPLVVVPVAGAMGGIFYYFMDHLRFQGGWIKILAILFSLFGYLIALWMGAVLGLDGTLWD